MNTRAILFINGLVEDYTFLPGLIDENDFLVAVDGGLRHLHALHREPKLIIGDLDSISPDQIDRLIASRVEILRYPIEKDETDLELALLETVKRKYQDIILIGALGGRIDQTLANLFLLNLSALAGKRVRILDKNQEVFLVTQKAEIQGAPGDTVSLLPLKSNAEGVTTTGLKYPLKNDCLIIERSRGISNQMTGNHAFVSLSSGTLLCIHSWS